MSTLTVTTQAALEAALADETVTAIDINSPAGTWINIGPTGGRIVNVLGKSTVDTVTGSVESVRDSGRVGSVRGSGRVGSVGGSGRVGSVRDSGSVGYVGDSGRVGSVRDSGSVGSVRGSGRVGSVGGSGRVGSVRGSGRVEKAAGTAVIQGVHDEASIGSAGPAVAIHVYSARATITGGVLIDLTHLDDLSPQAWCDHHGIDAARIQADLDHITTHPEEHDQSIWARKTGCGTARCMAGTAVIRAGIKLRWTGIEASYTEHGVPISTAAANLYGLSDEQATELFGGDNTLDDLWRIAGEITHGLITGPTPAGADTSDETSL